MDAFSETIKPSQHPTEEKRKVFKETQNAPAFFPINQVQHPSEEKRIYLSSRTSELKMVELLAWDVCCPDPCLFPLTNRLKNTEKIQHIR